MAIDVSVNDGICIITINRPERHNAMDGQHYADLSSAWTDILMESYRPGVMERLGLGYAELRKDRKDLICCSISAYGHNGPLSDRPDVDGIIQAASGLMSIIGHEGGGCRVSGGQMGKAVRGARSSRVEGQPALVATDSFLKSSTRTVGYSWGPIDLATALGVCLKPSSGWRKGGSCG